MRQFCLSAALILICLSSNWVSAQDALRAGFANPPQSAHPQTWWHWMNGNVTREGITADLEAMHRVGIVEANIITVASDIPPGPVQVMSPKFFDMVEFAAREADRLGMTLCMDNCPGWSSSGGPWVTPEHAMQMVVTSDKQVTGPMHFAGVLPKPTAKLDFYRDIAVIAFRTPAPGALIHNIDRKAIFSADEISPLSVEKDKQIKTTPEQVVQRDKSVNLTKMLQPDGTLSWDVPEGSWTILRIGYTPTGVTNHPAPPEATGLECDKLSRAGLDASWNGMMQPLLDKLGPLGGKVLVDCLIDSYETGGQNWTPEMIQEFQRRRGYDPTPYLPTLTGRIVDSEEISERFLWDWRRTIGDLFAENYFDYFAELCHKHGLKSLVEPYTGPFESLACGRAADVPMGEFWAGSNGQESVKLASSVGHTYGQNVIGAESFTGGPDHGRWTDDPYSLKALGDLAFSQGINRYIFHRFAHQPWMNRHPGMTMGQWGINLDRTNTWFELARPWLDYVSRSQFLLQQGRFVADAAYFCGESSPVVTRIGNPKLPRGFDYDSINADVLLKSSVKDGRLVLPDGMSYALLVLPPSDPAITPELLAKLRDLVKAGLTVVGEKPTHSPSLRNYPQCDADVSALAAEMWADCDGVKVTEHPLGKGKVVWGKPLAAVFAEMNLPPDFSAEPGSGKANQLLHIHRATGDGDIYFVANHTNAYMSADCTFRVSGKVPELWHPDTGVIETAPVYENRDGRTTLPLEFDPVGSVFVIFRRSSAGTDHLATMHRAATVPQPRGMIVIREAIYQADDGAATADVTAKMSALVEDGSLDISASNDVLGGDPAPNHVKHLMVDAIVNGQPEMVTVTENAQLTLPAGTGAGAPPGCDFRIAADGTAEMFARKPGVYEFQNAAGKSMKVDATQGMDQTPLAGPWELRFPPHWGAPASVTLDKLISWPDHPDAGVKYFSGTATYFRQLDIPAEMTQPGRSVFLDLGTVKNFAEVSINGKDLGILWKPPFRLDISTAIKPGKNDLQIKVTNLWPNRLIGDAQLPEDVEWVGMRPARWPQWLLDGKDSPTGRLTFTTWRHWTKEAKLLDSGLIGPVVLESGRWTAVH